MRCRSGLTGVSFEILSMASSSLLKEPHDHAAESERQNLNKQHRRPHECPSREAGSCMGARSCPAALNQTDVLVLLLTFIGLVTLIKSSDLSRGIFILLR
jgi:hypothetical protein